jgi:hypothetical protein
MQGKSQVDLEIEDHAYILAAKGSQKVIKITCDFYILSFWGAISKLSICIQNKYLHLKRIMIDYWNH